MENPFLQDRDRYLQLAGERKPAYESARPFAHAVFDDFLPPELGRQVLDVFPRPTDDTWLRFRDPTGLKLASADVGAHHAQLRDVLAMFNSAPFLQFLEDLTGIAGLIPDPWFQGGGLHQIPRGGFLKIHADFNRHEKLKLDRRINVLWYLNRDWQEEYGGHLELWNQDMSQCAARILPVFNRCVIFNTTDTAYHGHPDPLTCPENETRKSVALYYYTNGRPSEEVAESHTTLYQLRPDERRRTGSFGYKLRDRSGRVLDLMASIAHKPAGLLRRLADRVRPGY